MMALCQKHCDVAGKRIFFTTTALWDQLRKCDLLHLEEQVAAVRYMGKCKAPRARELLEKLAAAEEIVAPVGGMDVI